MDKHRSRKRSSILKKQSSTDSTPTATFTRQMRRISFSSKNSVKEFRSGDDKPTIWCNSYEQLDDDTYLEQNKNEENMKEDTLNRVTNEEVFDNKTNLNDSRYNLRSCIKQKYNFKEQDENICQKTTFSCSKKKSEKIPAPKIIMSNSIKENETIHVSKSCLTSHVSPNNIKSSTQVSIVKSQQVRPASMMATMEKKLQQFAQIAKKNDNRSANKNEHANIIDNINSESVENKHKPVRRTLTFQKDNENSDARNIMQKINIKNLNISIPYNQSEILFDDSLLDANTYNKSSVSLVRESLNRIEADLMLQNPTSNQPVETTEVLFHSITGVNDMEMSDSSKTNEFQNHTSLNNESDIDESILNITNNIVLKLKSNSHNDDNELSFSNYITCDSKINKKLHQGSEENLNYLADNWKTEIINQAVHSCTPIAAIKQPRETIYTEHKMEESLQKEQCFEKSKIIEYDETDNFIFKPVINSTETKFFSDNILITNQHVTLYPAEVQVMNEAYNYEKEDIPIRHFSKNNEKENEKSASRKTVYTVDNMDETTSDLQLNSQERFKSGTVNKQQDFTRSQGKITSSAQSRKTILGHDAMDVTRYQAEVQVMDEAYNYEKENIPNSHFSKNNEKVNEKSASRQTVYTVDNMDETTTDLQLNSQERFQSGTVNKQQDLTRSQGKITSSAQSRKTIHGHDAMDVTLYQAEVQLMDEAYNYEKENIPNSHFSKNNEKSASRQTVYTVDNMDETTTDVQLNSQERFKSGTVKKQQDLTRSQGKITSSAQSRKTILGHDAMDETLYQAEVQVMDEAYNYEKEDIPNSHFSKNNEKENEKSASRQTVYTVDNMDETTTDLQLNSQERFKSGTVNKQQDLTRSQGKITSSAQSRKTILGHDAMDVTLYQAEVQVMDEAYNYEKENIPNSHFSKNNQKENEKSASRQTVYTVDNMDETTTDLQLNSQERFKSGTVNKQQDLTRSQGKITSSAQSRKTILGHDAMDVTLYQAEVQVMDEAYNYEKENIPNSHFSKNNQKENEKSASRQTVYTVDNMDETTTDLQLNSQERFKSGTVKKQQDLTRSQGKITSSAQSRKTILGHDAMDETLYQAEVQDMDEAYNYEKENIPNSHFSKNNEKSASRQTVYTVDNMDETTTDLQLNSQERFKSGTVNKQQDLTRSEGKITSSAQSRKTILGHDAMDETLYQAEVQVMDEAYNYEKEDIPNSHFSKNNEKENEKSASRQTVYTVDNMDETTTDLQLNSQERFKSGTVNKQQDLTRSQGKITSSAQSRKTILGHDAMDVTRYQAEVQVMDEAYNYEKENIPNSHFSKNNEKVNEKSASRQTVYTVDNMDETITDLQLKSQGRLKSGTVNKQQDLTRSQGKITSSAQSRKTIFGHDVMDVTLQPAEVRVMDKVFNYEKDDIPISHIPINNEKENEKSASRQTVYSVDNMDETTTALQLNSQERFQSGTVNKQQNLTRSQGKITSSAQSRKTILGHDAMDVTLYQAEVQVMDEAYNYEKENIPNSHFSKNNEKVNEKSASRQTVYTVDNMDETTTDLQLNSQERFQSGTVNKQQDLTRSQGKITSSAQSRITILGHDAMDVTLYQAEVQVMDEAYNYEKENIPNSHFSKNNEKENEKSALRQTVYTVDNMDETTSDLQLKSQGWVKSGTLNKQQDLTSSQGKIPSHAQSRKTILGHDAMDVTLYPAEVMDEVYNYEKENIPISHISINNKKENEKSASRQTVYTVDDMDETTSDLHLKSQGWVKFGTVSKQQDLTRSQGKITSHAQSRKTILGHDVIDVTLQPAEVRVMDDIFNYEKEDIPISHIPKNNHRENEISASRQTVYTVDDKNETTTDLQLKSQGWVKSGTLNKQQDLTSSQGKIPSHAQSRKTILGHDAMDVTLYPAEVMDEVYNYEKENIPISHISINNKKENEKSASRQTVYTVDDMDETTSDLHLKSQGWVKSGTVNKQQDLTRSEGKITSSAQSRKTILGHDAMDETLYQAEVQVMDEVYNYEKENIPISHISINNKKENEKSASRQTVYTVDNMDETTSDLHLKSQGWVKSGTVSKQQDLTRSQGKITSHAQSRKTILGHDAMDVTLQPAEVQVMDEVFNYEKEDIPNNHIPINNHRENEKSASRQTVYTVDDMNETTTDLQLKSQGWVKSETVNKQQDLTRSEGKITSSAQSRKTILGHDAMDVTALVIDKNRISKVKNEKIIITKTFDEIQKHNQILPKHVFSEELELTVPKFNQYSFMEEYNHADDLGTNNTCNDISRNKFSSTKYYGRKSLCHQLGSVPSSRESTLTNSTQFLCNLNPLELSDDNKTVEKSHFYNINTSNCSNIDDSHLNINLISSLNEEYTNIDSKLIDNNENIFSNDDLLLLLSPIKKKKDFKLNFYTDEFHQLKKKKKKLKKEIEENIRFMETFSSINRNKVIKEELAASSMQYEPKIPSLKFLCKNYRDYIVHSADKTTDDVYSVIPAYYPLIPVFNKLLKNKIDNELTDWSYNDSYYYIDLLKFSNKKIKSIIFWISLRKNKIPEEYVLFEKVFIEEDFLKKPLTAGNLLKQREFLSCLPCDLTTQCKTSLVLIDFLNYINDICIYVHSNVNKLIELCIENDAELIIDADENICIKKIYINRKRKSRKIIFNINEKYTFRNHINDIDINKLDIGTNDKNYLNINKYAGYNGLLLIENILKVVPCDE